MRQQPTEKLWEYKEISVPRDVSRETTRLYLHLSNDWLAGEYLRAMAILDGLHTEPNTEPEDRP